MYIYIYIYIYHLKNGTSGESVKCKTARACRLIATSPGVNAPLASSSVAVDKWRSTASSPHPALAKPLSRFATA